MKPKRKGYYVAESSLQLGDKIDLNLANVTVSTISTSGYVSLRANFVINGKVTENYIDISTYEKDLREMGVIT